MVNNQAVETLTQYRYDEQGQLSTVINRNGDSVRSFNYADGVMVTHSNALGLGCHYRWETLGGQPRVVEHWTSDGEHFHFRYDLEGRTSWSTDVLGRELEVHYNADHRVIASRDYGGEHYVIELDDNGSMVGLGLPDGNRLQFKYDEFDGKGQVTRLQRTARGLPSSRQDAKGQRIRFPASGTQPQPPQNFEKLIASTMIEPPIPVSESNNARTRGSSE